MVLFWSFSVPVNKFEKTNNNTDKKIIIIINILIIRILLRTI